MRDVKCYFCSVKSDKSLMRQYDISRDKDRHSIKNFHENCLELYLEKRKEFDAWDELYNFIRSEIFRYPKDKVLNKHLVNKLLALRSGDTKLWKNQKVFHKEGGYSYEVILLTFKLKKNDIIRAINDNVKLQNEQQKIDYLMAIILSNINDIYIRIKEKEESEKRLQQIEINDDMASQIKYINKNKINDNKVANKLKHLF